MINILTPIWQWVIENRFEMERILKTIKYWWFYDAELIFYNPAVKYYVK